MDAETQALVERFTRLEAEADKIRQYRVRAETKLEDAEGRMRALAEEIKGMGYGSLAELQKVVASEEEKIRELLLVAEAKVEELE